MLETSNHLDELLAQAAKNPAVRPEFYRALLEDTLLVLTPFEEAVYGEQTLKKDENIKLVNWVLKEKQFIPVFTSIERMNEALQGVSEKYNYLAMKGSSLLSILSQEDTSMILNARCSIGKEFTINEIQQLANGKYFEPNRTEVVQKERKVLLGQPKEYPHELIDALKQLFSKYPCIEAAYLAHMVDPESGDAPHTLIGYRASGDCTQVLQDAGVIARELAPKGSPIDFTELGKGGGVEDYLTKETTPFYQKQG